MADRAADPAIAGFERVERDFRRGIAVFFVADFADGQIDPLGLHAGFCGGGFHALDGLGDYFQADVVAQ